jgi:hypothetical protein
MSIKRDPDELPGGVVVSVDLLAGKDAVDHEEYEEEVDADRVVYPAVHTTNAMTLSEMFPGYTP